MLSVLVATIGGGVDNEHFSTAKNSWAYAMHMFPVRRWAHNILSLHVKVANVRPRIRSLCRLDMAGQLPEMALSISA